MTDPLLKPDLMRIGLPELRSFIVSAGFASEGPWGKYLERYHLAHGSDHYDILIPTVPDIADYPDRMRDAINELSRAINDSPVRLLRRISLGDHRVFRLRAHPGATISSLPFDEGTALLFNSKRLIKASAVSAFSESHKKVIRGRSVAAVDDYMERVRIGQSDIGSYVFNILLPSGVGMFEAEDVDQNDDAVLTALQSNFALATEMSISKRVPAADKLEEAGMSANFCEALYNIIDWSETVAIQIDGDQRISRRTPAAYEFDRGSLSVLERTAAKLAPEEQPERVTIHGTITRLSEPASKRRGSIDLLAKVRERRRSVRIAFESEDRDVIIKAFKEKASRLLSVSGYLRTERNGHLVLNEPSGFDASRRGSLL